MLRHVLTFIVIIISNGAFGSESGIIGKVDSVPGCSKNVMVWLSLDESDYKKRLLLMHTEVPVGGKFQFYLRPGQYQLRATDEKGCEFYRKISVTESVAQIPVRMKK